MRKTYKIALAATFAAVAVPLAYYYLTMPGDEDPMAATLREFGFVRVPLATKLMNVGSLYYVDAGLRDFKTTCHVDKAELGDDVIVSPGMNIVQDLERKGLLTTGVTVDLSPLVNGAAENNSDYLHAVHLSLTDVVVEELPLDRNSLIYMKLMSDRGCNNTASRYADDAPRGYVCQVQKTFNATAEYKLDRDVHDDLKANAKLSDINGQIKRAMETHGNTNLVERDGRLYSGSALTYGVSMNPTCLAPLTSYFYRVLPQNRFDRFVNFVKFSVLEPLLPASASQPQLAQDFHAGDKQVDRYSGL